MVFGRYLVVVAVATIVCVDYTEPRLSVFFVWIPFLSGQILKKPLKMAKVFALTADGRELYRRPWEEKYKLVVSR